MKIEYPKYKDIKNLTSEDFSLLAYIVDEQIETIFNATGFRRKWMEDDGIENTILELIDGCLDDLRKNPKSKSAEHETGRIRIELSVYDTDGNGIERIEPRILLDVWSW